MKQKVKIAMEKILKLQEEFTEDELQEAMENLLKQIFNKEMRKSSRGKKAKIPKKGNQHKPLSDSVSRAVIQLEKVDPEKYKILFEFDQLLRSGKVLKKMEDIRKIMLSIDKSFDVGKSRKDAIPRLIKMFSNMEVDRINQSIDYILRSDNNLNREDEGYRDLASFIIQRQ